jgi:hypothetical protein
LLTFWDNLSVPSSGIKKSILLEFLDHEDGTGSFSQNVGKESPPYAVSYRRKAQISNPFFLDFLTHEDGTSTLSQNVSKELPPYAV